MDRSRQRNSRIEPRALLSVESLEDRRLLVTNVVAPVIEPFPAAQIHLAGGPIPEDAAHTLFVTESLFDVTSTNSVPASPNQIGRSPTNLRVVMCELLKTSVGETAR